MGAKVQKTEVVDVRLPDDLVKKLTTESLMRALEQTWLEAFSRGAEFGMHLIRESRRIIAAESKKKRRTKSKRKGSV